MWLSAIGCQLSAKTCGKTSGLVRSQTVIGKYLLNGMLKPIAR